MVVLPVCYVCVPCVFWVLDPLELELDMILSQHVGTVGQTQVLYKSSQYSKPLRHLSSPDRNFLYTGLAGFLSKDPDSRYF